MGLGQEAEAAILDFFHYVAQERAQLAADLTLPGPSREGHAVARDLAVAVVNAIDPEHAAGEPPQEPPPPPAEPTPGA